VESITIGKILKNGEVDLNSKQTYACDTILIAVGLNPVDEFYNKANQFNIKVWIAGDAQEIAEASAAIFTGKIEALKILREIGIQIPENVDDLEKLANLMKAKPPEPIEVDVQIKEEGVFPLFHCNQEIPCNPCTTVCPQEQIKTVDDLITQLPYFLGEQDCIGCGKCVAICPGLAITLVDYRKDKDNPIITFPLELTPEKIDKGRSVLVVSNEGELGEFEVMKARILKEYPKTQLVSVKVPSKFAKIAVGLKLTKSTYTEPMDSYQKTYTDDDIIVCRCERVSVGEIRKWIQYGVRDFNELKALTKVGMGACGGKTCTTLINRIFREEDVSDEKVNPGTQRPLFIEVPMGIFAGLNMNNKR
jgi:Fe-S-cluster-containing hydrogenase component 2/bacterioferritin-associated ferredoxin